MDTVKRNLHAYKFVILLFSRLISLSSHPHVDSLCLETVVCSVSVSVSSYTSLLFSLITLIELDQFSIPVVPNEIWLSCPISCLNFSEQLNYKRDLKTTSGHCHCHT